MPIDKKILCVRQINDRLEKKLKRKAKKQSTAYARGKANRRNGRKAELALIGFLRSLKLECDSVPLSGAFKGSFVVTDSQGKDKKVFLSSDVWVKIGAEQYKIECKRKQNGRKWHTLTMGGMVHIEGFCYAMNEEQFNHACVLGVDVRPTTVLQDKRTKAIHEYFEQDNCDIVAMFRPYAGFVFFVLEDTYKRIKGEVN